MRASVTIWGEGRQCAMVLCCSLVVTHGCVGGAWSKHQECGHCCVWVVRRFARGKRGGGECVVERLLTGQVRPKFSSVIARIFFDDRRDFLPGRW